MKSWLVPSIAVLALSSGPRCALAESWLFDTRGKPVVAVEQLGFVDSIEGRWLVSLAIRGESAPALWIVAIRGDARGLSAEPIAEFPHLLESHSIVGSAKRTLRDGIGLVGSLDTLVLMPIPLVLDAWNERPSRSPSIVPLHAKSPEPPPISITVLPGTSGELDRYLAGRELKISGSDLDTIRPFLDRDFSLICAWTAGLPARPFGLKVRMPDGADAEMPVPLSREANAASSFVRGWVTPTRPGVAHDFLRGTMAEVDLATLMPLQARLSARQGTLQVDVPLTRVDWRQATDDERPIGLAFTSESASVLELADFLAQNGLVAIWTISTALGGLLAAAMLPRLVLAETRPRVADYLWSAAVGIGGGFSILLSTFVYYRWLRARGLDAPFSRPRKRNVHDDEELSGVAVVLVLTPVAVTVLACIFRDPTLASAVAIVGMFGMPLFAIVWFIHRTWGRLSTLLAFFAVTHLAIVTVACIAIHYWIATLC